MAKSKQVRLTVTTKDGTVEIGRADLSKNDKGEVEIAATITNLNVHDQLGGMKIRGVVSDYEGDDL